MMRNRLLTVARGALLLIVAGGGEGVALDGKAVFAEQCASCHSTTGPAPASLEGVLKRKAPDLFYAGSKFNRDWLLQWIQSPSPIRRSGVMFLNHVVSEGGKDRIKEDTVKSCPSKLKADEAASVTEFLMALKDPKMRTGVVNREKKFSMAQALRLFTKQYPCIGCHAVKVRDKEIGGISGPPLTDAGARLNPDWVYARIENPQYWDPKTWMPKIDLSHEKRETLTLFVISPK